MLFIEVILFCLGLAFGSFLDVIASRYDPDKFLLTRNTLGGRSHCPHCKKTLAWYELVPIVSFVLQRGRCRSCGARISADHLWAEVVCGALFATVPVYVLQLFSGNAAANAPVLAAAWLAAFVLLLLLSLIDIRLQIIPDEVTIFLGLIALCIIAVSGGVGGGWLAHILAAAGAALFFGLLIFVTRGRGMGMGDAKLAFALGLLFGWPQTIFVIMLAFVVGAVVGVGLILARAKKLKSAVPFGPFLAVAALVVFFLAPVLVNIYINAFGL